MIVDTHTHVIAPDRERFPFRRAAGGGLTWPEDHPVDAEELLAEVIGAGVTGAVLVQASVYGTDNLYAASSAATHADRFVAIGIVDVEEEGRVEAAVRCVTEDGCRGVRLFDVPSSAPSWIDDGRAAEVARAVNAAGGRVCLTVLEPALSRVAGLAEAIPDIPIVIEHCGFADFSGGPPFEAAAPLFALAAHDKVVLKVTTTCLVEAEEAGIEPAVVVAALAEAFGADRLMWGSDYPQHHVEPYPALVDRARRSATHLDADQQADYLGGTAGRLWPELTEGNL